MTSPDPDLIVRIAARGDGVTADGRHVALSAPGDRLRTDGSIEAGPHHVIPPCRHFPQCGGCQLQHLSDEAFTDYVRDRVAGALAGQGLTGLVGGGILTTIAGLIKNATLKSSS